MERETMYENRSQGRLDFVKRISWSAVFAGVLVAVVTQILLTLLGLGIGLGTIDPLEESKPLQGLGIGSAIWYIISSLLSLFAGGWVAGRLASTPRLFDGIIHGVLTWCLATLLTLYFLTTTIGNVVGGASRLLGDVLGVAGQGIAAVAPTVGDAVKDELKENNLDLTDLRREVEQVLRQTEKPALQPDALEQQAEQAGEQAAATGEQAAANPQAADENIDNLMSQFIEQGENVANEFDRDAAINVVMNRTGKSRTESARIVDNWISTFEQAQVALVQKREQAEAKARQVADDTAAAASKGAIFGFIGLLLGMVASGFGAKLGTDSKDHYNPTDRPIAEAG
ncbi:MAG: hypothetical protein ACK4TA_05295 [Saprospiraceae bacterium]